MHSAAVRSFAFCAACSLSWLGSAAGAAETTTSAAIPARSAAAAEKRLTFELDIMPILTAAGCNAGACHGKARGQNGFQLSLLGFDADFDYNSIVKEARGRRVFPAAAQESLLLRKASARVPHGGGQRLNPDGRHYQTLRQWISTGLARRQPHDPLLKRIAISPAEHPLAAGSQQPLTVTAWYSDGSTRDVTTLCAYQSSETAVAAINDSGKIQAGKLPGETSIMARYMGQISTWNVVIPLSGNVSEELYAGLPRQNFIDGHVWNKLRQLGIVPSEVASDSTFMRRAFVDVIGRLPTPDEARAFLADSSSDKRERLVDALLERPEYADYWANKWTDLLRPNPYRVGIKATLNFDAWIREAFRRNLPYDQFVRELVTAKGSTWTNGATTLFRDRRSPEELTTIVSQLFLGVRLECAKCHHHPFEVWGQDDFYGLAAYFSRVAYKGIGLSPPISGGEETIYSSASGSIKHPLTGEVVAPKPLTGDARPTMAGEDPRVTLARWMTADANPYFATVAVNRVWNELLGRGIVDPVDDLRATNPASNPALLKALADDFRRQHYDLKKLIRTIMTSHVYGLSSLANPRNQGDTRNFSRHYRTRLRAETLLDAVTDITQVPETFAALPPGSRATALWNHRVESLFLDAFGRPDANQDPPCERTGETTMVQALHLMNSPGVHRKITSDASRPDTLAAGAKTASEIVDELYLLAYARYPTADERSATVPLFGSGQAERRRMTEDLLWALVNTPEFIFKD